MSKQIPKPCVVCGGVKEPGPGKRYCKKCSEERKPIIFQERYIERMDRVRQLRIENGGKQVRIKRDCPPGTKWCNYCEQFLPLNEFADRKGKGRVGKATYCKVCASAYVHETSLEKKYGISIDRYNELLLLQGGRCAICETKPRKQRLAVDHDHETGVVRGLLCSRCNKRLLGSAHDSTAMLRRAATYLDKPPAVTGQVVPANDDELFSLLMEAWAVEREEEPSVENQFLQLQSKSDPADAYVVMTGKTFTDLLRRAGYVNGQSG